MARLLLSLAMVASVSSLTVAAPVGPASDDQLQRWVDNLQSAPSFKVRMQAAILLGRSDDDRAVDPLIQSLGDDHFAVRGASCLALSRLGRAKGVLPLINTAATDDDDFVRVEARKALAGIDPKSALSSALAASEAGDADVRREALTLLAGWDDNDAEMRLVEALGDVPAIYQLAHDALMRIPEAQREKLLERGLQSAKLPARLGAAALLGELATARAAALLMDAYDQENDNPDVRRALRDHLRLLRRLMPEHQLLGDAAHAEDRFVRARALKFLGVLGSAQAIDELIDALDTPDVYLRGVAALSLAEAGDPRAITPLMHLMDDQDNARIAQIVRNSIQILERREAPLRN